MCVSFGEFNTFAFHHPLSLTVTLYVRSLLRLNICIQMTSKSECDCMFDPVTVLSISNIFF